MLSDIEIAQKTTLKPIQSIAEQIGLEMKDLDLYGNYKAKINTAFLDSIQHKADGKLVLVTAMNPTPAGEGKTTVSIGLAQGLNRIGQNAILALREPSLGPVFGVKGGAAGGGYSQVLPMEDINLHFTGDLHAITTANNLLAALIDNHIFQGNALDLNPDRVLWKRCIDMNDRNLREVQIGLGSKFNGVERSDAFTITAASEIMSILCLSTNLENLKSRLGNIIIGYDMSDNFVRASDLNAADSLAIVLKEALKPNLVQTIEHTPAILHGGPFANISFGCNSLIATKAALKLSDIVITEAGFGADLGAEKFLDIKCRQGNIWPNTIVLVATIRSLKFNGGIHKDSLNQPNLEALKSGFSNLSKHIENIQNFKVPCVVAINQFPSDTQEEIDLLMQLCKNANVDAAITEVYAQGGLGGESLAKMVCAKLQTPSCVPPAYTYSLEDSIALKIKKVATKIYGAQDIEFSSEAKIKIEQLELKNFSHLPICMAKTQYSLSDDPTLLGQPQNFTLKIRDLYLAAGAGFIVVLTGKVLTMPGLPPTPAAVKMSIDNEGKIDGLF